MHILHNFARAVLATSIAMTASTAGAVTTFDQSNLNFSVDQGFSATIDAIVTSTYSVKNNIERSGFDLTGFKLINALTNAEVVLGAPTAGYPITTTRTAGRNTFSDTKDSWSLASTALSSGSYRFVVSGTGTQGFSGSYNLNLTALPPVSSPVPEPSTYAMLLLGLGVLAFASRRGGASRHPV
ncbi:FxDxF family PEP-CTERM protein [Noviherbaspirillum aridicola]|uniref:Ice-binding protein C-terminal domain-containing protein n=1 Tax=Noviherbaspirillum aridicola TaxID=2849687 RepID=A0ABQ4Q5L7_9BURK|nr:FxDxF family PEP-CTERM protein [Noviherbaspirillum aridicola]GIZ52499.1 hypothetical protein NCCP691_25130 [Noviherbaspirillum aridicola]